MWVRLVPLTVSVPYSIRDPCLYVGKTGTIDCVPYSIRDTVYMWVRLVPLNVSVPYSNRDTGLYVGKAGAIDSNCALQ